MEVKKKHSQGVEKFADHVNTQASATPQVDYNTYRNQIFNGDCLEVLKKLPSGIANCCVTSPPYYGLRDYGTGIWVGGDPNCNHNNGTYGSNTGVGTHKFMQDNGTPLVGEAHLMKKVCTKCGAVRVDKQIGLEESPEQYVEKLVEVFREIKRVLTDDGTLWLNIGDTYNSSSYRKDEKTSGHGKQGTNKGSYENVVERPKAQNCKPKDLIGIPWMLAFALRADGWYLRQDIIWHKPNPMPESVKDRCVKSHEYIFLLSKKKNYYFDYQAIQEDALSTSDPRLGEGRIEYEGKRTENAQEKVQQSFACVYEKRSKRDVWTIPPSTISEAHFATFPEKLVEPCILAGCPKGGVVIDPFFGSGTTGRVALGLDRDYIGIELNPQYIKIAEKRTDEIQMTMFN